MTINYIYRIYNTGDNAHIIAGNKGSFNVGDTGAGDTVAILERIIAEKERAIQILMRRCGLSEALSAPGDDDLLLNVKHDVL